ncbi:MAG: POTRA domain-containing protein [Legionella sp.]|nr:POTRA domain-containing protein [Legionella sp.]
MKINLTKSLKTKKLLQCMPEFTVQSVGGCLLILISPFAQAIDFNPSSVEAGVIGRSISSSPTPLVPGTSPTFTPQIAEPPPISGEASKISFVLKKIVIDGNHAFDTVELEAIFAPYINKKITVAQLQKLVQDVTDKYQKAGYFLSKAFLPPQEIHNGTVKVTVIEGFISSIKVQGTDKKRVIHFIEQYGANIQASRPIKLAHLERTLLLMNDVPGFTVKSVLAPDPAVPLGSTLTLLVEQKVVEATFTQDNYQTRYLGPEESSLFGSLNSAFIPGGTLFGRVLTANEHRKLQYYELKYNQTIGTNGWVLSVDGYTTQTHPQFILTPLELYGTSNNGNVTLSYPLIRSRKQNLSILGQFEYMDNTSTALGQLLYKDPIRDALVSAIYSDTVWKGDDTLSIAFDKGLNIFNANIPDNRSRLGASNNFLRIIGTASREQMIGSRFSLFALVTAQYANAVLPAAETITFGGPYIGRGYDWAQFTGDNGVAGKVELRVNTAPNLAFLKQVQYYTFYDAGEIRSLIPGVLPTSGASAGFGARAMIIKHLNAEGFIGRPLTAPNATQVILGNSGHAFLGYFQISAYL